MLDLRTGRQPIPSMFKEIHSSRGLRGSHWEDGVRKGTVNICFCWVFSFQHPPPIRRAVLKNEECCLGFCKEDPRTCINERRGSRSWQKNVLSQQEPRGSQRAPELVDWAAETPACLASPAWLAPCCTLEEHSPQSLDSPYMGQLMSSVERQTPLRIVQSSACDQTVRHCSSTSIREVLSQQFVELGCKSRGHSVYCITSFISLVVCVGIEALI